MGVFRSPCPAAGPSMAPDSPGVVAAVYAEAETPLPTADRAIAPLARLIAGLPNLLQTELRALTAEAAVAELLRIGGLVERPAASSREPLAGHLYAMTSGAYIFVERDDILVRRRFSAAHELGHYVLHFRPVLREPDSEFLPGLTDGVILEPDSAYRTRGEPGIPGEVADRLPPYEQMEREADRFAAELLMPEAIVLALAERWGLYQNRHQKEEDLVWRLATEMLVSRAAMKRRLQDLGLLSPGGETR
jgi:hypothetical protein